MKSLIICGNHYRHRYMIKPVIQKFKIKHHSQKNSYDEKLDSLLFYSNFRPKNQLYPWRIIFLIQSLLFDTKFFFTKLTLLVKK